MKWWAETTEWSTPTTNGIYLLDDSRSKMYAYRPHARAPIKTFRSPIKIDIRGRRFVVNPTQYQTKVQEQEPQGRSWTVKGSKGDEYRVTESGGTFSCSCTGFRFRGACKHIKAVAV